MTFEVWHDDHPTFMATHDRAMRWPTDFTHVATVEAPALGAVFQLTNHIDAAWTENTGVTAHVGRPRSTSVGDVVVDENREAWICAMVGWEKI